MSFPSLVSKNQIQKLAQANIHSLYDLITFLPFDLENIAPIDSFFDSNTFNTGFNTNLDINQTSDKPNSKTKYLFQGVLTDLQIRSSAIGQSYLYLSLKSTVNSSSANHLVQCYYFASSQYTAKSLKIGLEYQIILINNGNLWSVDKLALKTETQSNNQINSKTQDNFKLGNATIQNYLLPKYPKRGVFMSQFFAQIHSQLPEVCYQLDLTGFVPTNAFLPNKINLFGIHHPKISADYFAALQNWTALGVFKKLALMKCLDQQKEQKYAKSSQLDIDFLKQLSGNLPFDLSISQKTAIWTLLIGITDANHKLEKSKTLTK